jgi:tetratricopeptide (TPR) repeat protein
MWMRFLPILLPILFAGALVAQYPGLTLPPSGNNQKAEVTQYIGPVRVTIEYSIPAVHTADGKDRRGQIWGKLVPYGLADLGPFGNGKPNPWRAGANENTVFTAAEDVLIEGEPLPAGRYGLHMIPGKEEWIIVFSKNSNAWGSFSYDESADALRVTVKPHPHEYREYLTYEFPIRKPAEAVAELQWEELAVPWTIRVGNVVDIYISRLRQELTSVPGFNWQGFQSAAQYCVQENTHLEQGLKWAEDSITKPFVGEANFTTLSTKAEILAKLGRNQEANSIMETAIKLPSATALAIHQYGRQLLAAKKVDEAFAVFQYNASRYKDEWPVHVGLARGYAAKGDTKQALEHAKKAVEQAPDPLNKQSLEAMVKALESGQPIN